MHLIITAVIAATTWILTLKWVKIRNGRPLPPAFRGVAVVVVVWGLAAQLGWATSPVGIALAVLGLILLLAAIFTTKSAAQKLTAYGAAAMVLVLAISMIAHIAGLEPGDEETLSVDPIDNTKVVSLPTVKAGFKGKPLVGADTVFAQAVTEKLDADNALSVPGLYDPTTGKFEGVDSWTQALLPVDAMENDERELYFNTIAEIARNLSYENSLGWSCMPSSYEEMRQLAALEAEGVNLTAIVVQNRSYLGEDEARQMILDSGIFPGLDEERVKTFPVVYREGSVTNTYSSRHGHMSFYEDGNSSVRLALGVPTTATSGGGIPASTSRFILDVDPIESGCGVYGECLNPTKPFVPAPKPTPEPTTPTTEPPTTEPPTTEPPTTEPPVTVCLNPETGETGEVPADEAHLYLPPDDPECGLEEKPTDPGEWKHDDEKPTAEAPKPEQEEETLPVEDNPIDEEVTPGEEVTDPEVEIPSAEIPADPDHHDQAPEPVSPAPTDDPGTGVLPPEGDNPFGDDLVVDNGGETTTESDDNHQAEAPPAGDGEEVLAGGFPPLLLLLSAIGAAWLAVRKRSAADAA